MELESGVGSVPVVAAEPGLEVVGAVRGVRVGLCIGPFA